MILKAGHSMVNMEGTLTAQIRPYDEVIAKGEYTLEAVRHLLSQLGMEAVEVGSEWHLRDVRHKIVQFSGRTETDALRFALQALGNELYWYQGRKEIKRKRSRRK